MIRRMLDKLGKAQYSQSDVANILQDFLAGSERSWEWDDFISVQIENPELELVRIECLRIRYEHPAGPLGPWCDEEGMEIIRTLANELLTK